MSLVQKPIQITRFRIRRIFRALNFSTAKPSFERVAFENGQQSTELHSKFHEKVLCLGKEGDEVAIVAVSDVFMKTLSDNNSIHRCARAFPFHLSALEMVVGALTLLWVGRVMLCSCLA